jgi:ABC-type glutathione transport system ATPase component
MKEIFVIFSQILRNFLQFACLVSAKIYIKIIIFVPTVPQADLYLLDDPLAALDAHVGRDVFNAVIGPAGLLARRGATRLLVTHAVAVLKHVDRIVVMREGTVSDTGTFEELQASQQGLFAEFLRDHLAAEKEPAKEGENQPLPPSSFRLSRSLETTTNGGGGFALFMNGGGDLACSPRRGNPCQTASPYRRQRRPNQRLRSVSESCGGEDSSGSRRSHQRLLNGLAFGDIPELAASRTPLLPPPSAETKLPDGAETIDTGSSETGKCPISKDLHISV